MLRTVAIENYRSLRDVVTELDTLNVVTGANGTGKTSVYRALRLLADLVREGAISTLAKEGGMRSALHAGVRERGPVAMRLGFASDELSYAIDLGLPPLGPFHLDPEVKTEAVWAGPVLRPATLLAERRGPRVRTRDADGVWQAAPWTVGDHESLMSALADPSQTPELYAIRQQATRWRFYDHFRTDSGADARRPGVATFTPVLAAGGDDLAAALLTIERIGWAQALQDAVASAFDGSALLTTEDDDGGCRFALRQPGIRRPLGAAELSDGTLRFLLLAAALLSPRPPGLLVLNEPESSLHASLMPALAALVVDASERSQVVVVTHSPDLVRALRPQARLVELEKSGGATTIAGQPSLDGPAWAWPQR
ncbi:AAA family ATPase [Cellulomonas aerilata]|uniref:ATPase n=1 Tax=Cellulomonas aerilata TaxID=515326 RepID=A0A512DCJ9_9CELL|nr:AAA family ATPase [Cellulomonas aerilata]GEO34208.1 ATPase [Cellulomonas aerilata]